MSTKPPVSAEEVAETFESLAPATDRARLAGLDHARRVQAGRIGATERRLALTRARRGGDDEAIARLESRLVTEQRVDGAYARSVTRAEIQIPERKAQGAAIHGIVFGADGGAQKGLTVAAVGPKGAVERFTCTDARGYFRIDLALAEGKGGPVYLQVSDPEQAVLYRGEEAIALTPGGVTYREIRLSGDRLPPCPMPPDRATMPRLLDLAESEALALLGRFGLEVAQRLIQTAPKRVGLVVSQEPVAGTPVTGETKVTLVIGVAEGGALVTVPDVSGLSRDEADARLAEANLVTGQIAEARGDPVGIVLRQKPKAGTQVEPGTPVDLTVSVAVPDDGVEVPDVVGKEAQDALAILKEAGLESGRVSFRDGEPAGIVVEQDPKAGSRVRPATGVNLVVGRERASERVDTPNVIGRTLAGATEILDASKLKLGDVSGNRDGTVAEQKPVAGEPVPAGSAVSLRLARTDTPATPTRPIGPTRPVAPLRPVAPVPVRAPAMDTTFADGLSRRIAADPGFQRLGISAGSVSDSLEAANVTDKKSAARLVELDNASLARTFALSDLNKARSMRRMLREALEQM